MVLSVPFLSEVSYHINQDGARSPRTVTRGFSAPADHGLRQERGRGSGCVWSVSMRHRKPQAPGQEDTLFFHYSWSFNASPCSLSSNWKASRPFPRGASLLLLLFRSASLFISAQQQWNQLFELESKTPAPLHLAFQTFPIWTTLRPLSSLPSQPGHSFRPGESILQLNISLGSCVDSV